MRFVGQVLLMAAILGPAALPGLLRTKRLGLQIFRSFLMAATTAGNFIAVGYLRLDQTVSIAFLAPLVVAALAGPILGEYVGWKRALAIVAGFIGILIVVHPGVEEVHWAFAASFVSMLAYALFMIVTRILSPYDPPLVTLFYAMLVGAVGGALIAIPQWVWPTEAWQWLALASLGAFGGLGHYLLIFAYRYAPASSVSPFLYFQILSMVALGYLVFGDTPDAWSLIGLGRRDRVGRLSRAPRAQGGRHASGAGGVSRASVSSAHAANRFSSIASRIARHQVLIEDRVDPRQDHRAEILAGFDEVVHVRARILARCGARAMLIERR